MNALHDVGDVTETGVVRFQRVLPGPIERVWEFLTDSEKRGRWLASGVMEQRVGGTVSFSFRNKELAHDPLPTPEKYQKWEKEPCNFTGKILECDPPRKLRFTWGGTTDGSEVTVELVPQGPGVLLVLTHRRLATRDEKLGVCCGWHTHLDVLVDILNGREPKAFWPKFAHAEDHYTSLVTG